MKYALYPLVLLLMLCSNAGFTQSDSIPYKIGKYDVKKQEKVYVVAGRLQVDPNIIVKLNKLRNVQQDLVPGQRIRIPVYPKGYIYEAEKVIIHKSIEPDSAQLALLNSTSLVQEAIAPPSVSPEEASNQLMLLDAMLELNEAMLEGVKASMDTLNKKDEGAAVDEKNIQVMLQRMKRSRDKVLLLPYLVRLNDSLSNEIVQMRSEREKLEAIINPPAPVAEEVPIIKNDTLISGTDTIVYQTTTTAAGVTTEVAEVKVNEDEIVKDDASKVEIIRAEKKNRKFKQYYPVDTIIIYDLGPTAGKMKPEPEKKKIEQPTYVRGKYWDTARAVNPIMDTSASNPIAMLKDTTLSLKIRIPNTLDSVVIKPIRAPKPEPILVVKDTSTPIVVPSKSNIPKTDTVPSVQPITILKSDTAKVLNNETLKPATTLIAPATDTVVTNQTFRVSDTIPVAIKKQSVGDMALAASDSVKRIKAVFFYKRAQKAMSEKNFRNAEQYLEKSVELSPNYYDAWFAMAEMNALFGSTSNALKQYQKCQNIDSGQSKLHYRMGELYLKIKRKGDALSSFTKAIQLNPTEISAYMERAAIERDYKQFDKSIADYDQVVKINRSYHYAYKARGEVYVLNHNYTAAIDDFTRYLIFENTDPSAYYYRGLAKIANNELLEGCLDLSTSSEMGYTAATRAIKKSCE
ncbi:MAG: tetratricopeptide repeat protein [Bacteroidetes bacterium]|nr:tetratricopeptide repeat protein [Bacteroidota bacterium]